MSRPLRIEYSGAIYHLTNYGDHAEAVFRDDEDHQVFLGTLGEAAAKTGWQVHAFCLLANHFHLVVETPQPDLVAGMKWFLGTYTGRFNRRHQVHGHLFSGRYKSLLIDERAPGYLRAVCDHVHLNPVRSGGVGPDQPLSNYPWSSFPLYLSPAQRPPWLRVDRLLREHEIQRDTDEGRKQFELRMEQQRGEGESPELVAAIHRGWRLGGPDFLHRLTEKLGRYGQPHELAWERHDTDAERAEGIVRERLSNLGWTEANLIQTAKSHREKVRLARQLRQETPMTRAWIAHRLGMGSASYVSFLLGKIEPGPGPVKVHLTPGVRADPGVSA